jgi:DNA-binding CsgD family transcriptional regulator
MQRRSSDLSLLEPFLSRIVKSRDWIQQYQDSTIEVAHIVSESDTYYLEGRYWRFHQPIEFESSLVESSPERIERVFVDPIQPATTHANYLFRSELLTIEIDRDRQIERNSTIESLCEGDRYLLDFIYPHLFQAYQNSIFFTETQQQLMEIDRDRQIERNYTIESLCEGDRYLLDFIYPHLFQAYQNSIFFTETQQQLMEIDRSKKQSFSVESAQSLGLTKREAEVLWSIAKDKSNSDIATSLECSLGTVKKHLEHIYEKLEVQTRTAAVMTALTRLGLISN